MGSTRHKPEFPPLLQPGLHDMSAGDMKALVVDNFPLSTRRAMLWQNLTALIDQLKALSMPCKVWVDGSFLTEKIDPDDVDFVADFPIHVIENATPAQEALLNQLVAHAFCKIQKLHSFVMFDAPIVHKDYATSSNIHEQWKRDFGFSYVKKTPKGIAVFKVQP